MENKQILNNSNELALIQIISIHDIFIKELCLWQLECERKVGGGRGGAVSYVSLPRVEEGDREGREARVWRE